MKETPVYKVAHLSSAHKDRDVRIFHKECSSLASQAELDVHLVLADVDERVENDVTIHSVEGAGGSRIKRMWNTVNKVYKKAVDLDADVYHLHDPELLRIALKLKKRGKKVIYDAHEDLPRQILGKDYLKFKKTISRVVERYENRVVRKLDAVITATPFIRDRFKQIHPNTVDINNFPMLKEVSTEKVDVAKENKICFIGGITRVRGIGELVDALDFVEVTCAIAGSFPEDFRSTLTSKPGWNKVEELGFIDRDTSLKLKAKSIAGIVTFLPYPNHINAQPNKIFEYMASGLPVIGSHFDLWKAIIEENKCGICVDPEKPTEIADAISYIQENPEEAIEMGERGRKQVLEVYNWGVEEAKLFILYKNVIGQ
ncbi:MAG: glycosyl transferase [Fluviicola sp. XM-24bin1]|nr:MAG: glycosyl transferase [Fluviicola sp. XM-24bin1]